MEQARLPVGYQRRPPKRSHTRMEQQDRSAFAADQGPPAYRSHEQEQRDPSVDVDFNDNDGDSDFLEDLFGVIPSTGPSDPAAQYSQPESEQRMAPHTERRFPGDGFDYRRPVSSARDGSLAAADHVMRIQREETMDLSHDSDVIDLTADDDLTDIDDNAGSRYASNSARQSEQPQRSRSSRPAYRRLPRGMDIIIDLDNGEEEWRPVPEPGSPEIEVISSREVIPPAPANNHGDEVEFLGMQPLSAEQMQRRRDRERDEIISVLERFPMNGGQYPHLRAQIERFNHRRRPMPPPRGVPRGASRPPIRLGFAAPLLDFDMVGFDMGMGGARPREPPPPTYNKPESVPEGFTRSPEEADVLVCPNCDCELCTGEDEVKRQVWIAKACGHVYCGECTTNRSMKRTPKGKERTAQTNPFKECVVEGCGKKVSNPRAMIQVFL